MNENLNLVEILKDCPKGMELDCTMFDNVTFAGVVENRVFPIRIIVGGGTTMVLTKYGQYTDDDFAKCVIFPKGETTWEGFVPPHKFKDWDKLVNRVNMYMGDLSPQCVISEITNDKYILNDGGYIHFKNQDIWELAPDKKHRFDPKTLHPFDRVLVRLTRDCIWNATFFSHYDKEVNWGCYPCVTTSCKSYDRCIPYNDETKHLLGTSDEAPEYYRYWED